MTTRPPEHPPGPHQRPAERRTGHEWRRGHPRDSVPADGPWAVRDDPTNTPPLLRTIPNNPSTTRERNHPMNPDETNDRTIRRLRGVANRLKQTANALTESAEALRAAGDEIMAATEPTPPQWKPEVGGTVETIEQYKAMPIGSVVAYGIGPPYHRHDDRFWTCVGKEATPHYAMAARPRTILRMGWES